jgi:hypothetical protein
MACAPSILLPHQFKTINMSNESFKVRAYGFGELAQLYFPTITKKSASAQLRRWIKFSKNIQQKLQDLDYEPGRRILTPAHVKVLIDEFGEP